MAISKEKKKEILLSNFEIIKDNYEDNSLSIASVVIKMFKIDVDMAIEMWMYLVTKYAKIIKYDESWPFIGNILYNGEQAVEDGSIYDIVVRNSVLKNAIFAEACDDISVWVADVIRRMLEIGELSTADELLALVYNNKYMDNSFYEILDDTICDDPDDMNMTEDAYELLETWCEKVTNKEDRAKLSIKMMEYMD